MPGLRPLFAVVLFLIGMLSFPLAVIGWDFTYLPGDLVDTRFNLYVLEHGYRWLQGLESSFWNLPIFYPARRVTAYSDAHLGTLLLYAGLRQLGCSAERALQVWWLIFFVLNYWSAVFSFRALGCSWIGSACGAYLFAFGLATQAPNLLHVQLGPRFLVPPLLVLAWRWAWHPRQDRLLALGLLLVGQMYLTIYIGYFVALFLGVLGLVLAILYRHSLPWPELLPRTIRPWLGRFAIASLSLLLLVPLLRPYVLVSPERGHFAPGFLTHFLPTAWSWFSPAQVSTHALWMPNCNDPTELTTHELQLFPGFVVLAALAWGLFRSWRDGRQRPLVLAWTLATVVIVALTLRVQHASLYYPLYHLPAVRGIQAVSRIILILAFPLGYLLAELLTNVRSAAWVGVVVGGVLVADQSLNRPNVWNQPVWAEYRFAVHEADKRQEQMRQKLAEHPEARLVYVFPVIPEDELESRRFRLDAMRVCQERGIPCVHGWSGSTPLGYHTFRNREAVLHWLEVMHGVDPAMVEGLVTIRPSWPGP